MVLKLFSNLKNLEAGITLIEVIVTVAIIVLFSSILIADYPKIQRQFALSRTAYRLAQDLRRVEDLGLSGSGAQTVDMNKEKITARGYGIYVNLADIDPISKKPEKYIIYADVPHEPDNPASNSNKTYDGNIPYNDGDLCINKDSPHSDCILEIIDVREENPNLYVQNIVNDNSNSIGDTFTSINFTPPHPTIDIDNRGDGSKIGIVLGLSADNSSRTVWVNTSGLIEVK